MKIVFDLDGVLVDFVRGFTTLANKTYGTPIYGTNEQKEWEKFDELSSAQVGAVWKQVDASSNFWLNLPPLADTVELGEVGALTSFDDVYFVTSRGAVPGTKHQTDLWLKYYLSGWNDNRSVVLCKDKAAFCNAIRVDAILEDRPKNALWVLYQCPKTRVYLIDRPYNRLTPEAWAAVDEHHKIKRVQTVHQFLELLSYQRKGQHI